LPSTVSIADLFSKPLPTITHQRIVSLIGAGPTVDPLASADPTATVVAPTLVASTATVDSLAAVVRSASDLVPLPHPNPLPIVLDTGASFSRTPFASDFCVGQAPYGLLRSSTSVVSKALTSNPVDPYTLITGEDVSVSVDSDPFDLSSPDTTIDSSADSNSNSDLSSFAKVHFDIRAFGTATLTFIYSKSTSELLHIFVEPTQIDWLHWVPLPRLILPESYYHIFGLDYLQAFALFHLIPLWIALVSALLRSE